MVSDVLVDVFLFIYIYKCIIHVTSHMLDLVISHLHVAGFDRNVFQRTSPICMVIQMAERRKPKMLPYKHDTTFPARSVPAHFLLISSQSSRSGFV